MLVGRRETDLAGELVPASGDRPDQPALRSQRRAQHRDLALEGALLHHPVRPDARHQRVFADNDARRLDQRHQHVEGPTAELDRLAVGKQFAPMRYDSESAERDAPRWFEAGFHFATVQEISGNLNIGQNAGSLRQAERLICRIFQAHLAPVGRRRDFSV
jgi:hypothetical protein